MTALELCRVNANELNKTKRYALREGRDVIEVTNSNGDKYHLFYHNGGWFDRPSTVRKY